MRVNGFRIKERGVAMRCTRTETSMWVSLQEGRPKGKASTSGLTERHMKENGIREGNMDLECGVGSAGTLMLASGTTVMPMVLGFKSHQMAISMRENGNTQ